MWLSVYAPLITDTQTTTLDWKWLLLLFTALVKAEPQISTVACQKLDLDLWPRPMTLTPTFDLDLDLKAKCIKTWMLVERSIFPVNLINCKCNILSLLASPRRKSTPTARDWSFDWHLIMWTTALYDQLIQSSGQMQVKRWMSLSTQSNSDTTNTILAFDF